MPGPLIGLAIRGAGIALRGAGKALSKKSKPLKKSIERKVSRKLAAAGGAGTGSLPFTTKKKKK